MNTPDLNQAKIIVCSATSSATALAALKAAGFDNVWQSSFVADNYCVSFGAESVGFLDDANTGKFYVFFNMKIISPELRIKFLESQQNPTSVVPAAESVEAHPTTLTEEDLLSALGPIFSLEESSVGFQRLVLIHSISAAEKYAVCSFEPHQFDVLDLSIREFLSVIFHAKIRFNKLVELSPSFPDTHLSTETVDK